MPVAPLDHFAGDSVADGGSNASSGGASAPQAPLVTAPSPSLACRKRRLSSSATSAAAASGASAASASRPSPLHWSQTSLYATSVSADSRLLLNANRPRSRYSSVGLSDHSS